MADERADGLRLAIFTDTYPPQVNGVARTLERLAQAIDARGGAVRIVTVADPEAEVQPSVDRWPSIPFWAYPQLRIAAPSRQRAMDVIDEWKPTLVHVTTEFGVGIAGLLAAREAGVPVVSSYHTHFKAYLEFYKLTFLDGVAWPYIRWFHNLGARTFCPSGVVARELEAQGLDNIRVWSRGVDAHRFSPSFRTAAMRERLGVTRPDQTLVVYVGRLAREKGMQVLLQAMHEVRARGGAGEGANGSRGAERERASSGVGGNARDRIVFALVGDGPAEAECRAGAPEGTVFTGKLTGRELSEAYAAADVFAFP